MKQKLYTDSPLRIPFPVYLVFYNGSMEEPERREILLSDLFIQNGKELQLPKEQLLEKLMNSFSLSVEDAEEYIEKYSKF